MKKKFILAALIVTIFLVIIGTGFYGYRLIFREEIKGRIMVVQRNTDVKRLALIHIYAISAGNAEVWRTKVVNNCRRIVDEVARNRKNAYFERKRIIAENDSSIDRLDRLISAAVESCETSREIWLVNPNQPSRKSRFFEALLIQGFPSAKDIEADALNARWDKCYESLRNSVIPELQERLNTAKKRKASELKQYDLELIEKVKELTSEYSMAVSFESLTDIPASIKVAANGISDDNGEFSINLPIGDYYLIARGTRRVIDSDEHYFWARPVSVPSDESKRCLMGNNNMLGSTDPNMWTEFFENLKGQRELK